MSDEFCTESRAALIGLPASRGQTNGESCAASVLATALALLSFEPTFTRPGLVARLASCGRARNRPGRIR